MVSLSIPPVSGTTAKVSNSITPNLSIVQSVSLDERYSTYSVGASYSTDRFQIEATASPLEKQVNGHVAISPIPELQLQAAGAAQYNRGKISHDETVGIEVTIPNFAVAQVNYNPHNHMTYQVKVMPHEHVILAVDGHLRMNDPAPSILQKGETAGIVSINSRPNNEGFRRLQLDTSLSTRLVARGQITYNINRHVGVAAELQANLRTRKTCLTVGYEGRLPNGDTVLANVDTQGLAGASITHPIGKGSSVRASVIGRLQQGSFQTGIQVSIFE